MDKIIDRTILTCITLFIAFTALRLTGIIAWPWFWIISPIWAMVIVMFLFVGIVTVSQYLTDKLD